MTLHELHKQAAVRALRQDVLVEPQRLTQEARLAAELGRPENDVVCPRDGRLGRPLTFSDATM